MNKKIITFLIFDMFSITSAMARAAGGSTLQPLGDVVPDCDFRTRLEDMLWRTVVVEAQHGVRPDDQPVRCGIHPGYQTSVPISYDRDGDHPGFKPVRCCIDYECQSSVLLSYDGDGDHPVLAELDLAFLDVPPAQKSSSMEWNMLGLVGVCEPQVSVQDGEIKNIVVVFWLFRGRSHRDASLLTPSVDTTPPMDE